MIVSLNMSREVYDYFKNYDLSDVANCLLEQYDITVLPPTSGQRDVERTVNITDPVYIQLYNAVGPRSKKVSLGRLFEFAYNMDVLANPYFKVKPTKNKDNPAPSLVNSAYRTLLLAQKYEPDNKELKQITELVYELSEVMKC